MKISKSLGQIMQVAWHRMTDNHRAESNAYDDDNEDVVDADDKVSYATSCRRR